MGLRGPGPRPGGRHRFHLAPEEGALELPPELVDPGWWPTILAFGALTSASHAWAESGELVVLLDTDVELLFVGSAASATPQIVAAINRGESPGGLGVERPSRARVAISGRAAGRAARWIEDHPRSLLARLQRYIVLGYSTESSLNRALVALEDNRFVELVGRNLPVDLHASAGAKIPNDGLLGIACGAPETTQHGIHQLRFPEAWSWATGHGYVGLIDTGAEMAHPDLRAFHEEFGALFFDGGNLRSHLSRDVDDLNCSVDERDPDDDPPPGPRSGHGTHTSGIVGATTDNQQPGDPPGAAGVCWHCSLLMARTAEPGTQSFLNSRADGLEFLSSEAVRRGPGGHHTVDQSATRGGRGKGRHDVHGVAGGVTR